MRRGHEGCSECAARTSGAAVRPPLAGASMGTRKRFSPWYLVIFVLAAAMIWIAFGFLARVID